MLSSLLAICWVSHCEKAHTIVGSMANGLSTTVAAAAAQRCKSGNDEDSCGNLDGCSWYAKKSACGPSCETLGAGPCKDPTYGCEWSGATNKCGAGAVGAAVTNDAATGCLAYTSSASCNAGTGCSWDTEDNQCYAACDKQTTSGSCGGLRSRGGAQRCLWANGKCARRVVAQCKPLWEDNSETVGVVAGSSKMPMDAGQVTIIIIVTIATLIVMGLAAAEHIFAIRGAAQSGGRTRRMHQGVRGALTNGRWLSWILRR